MLVQTAHLYATACLAIVFFQLALIAGLPLGAYTQGGRHPGALPLSGRLIAAVSIPVLLFQGLAILGAAGFPGLDWPRWCGWVALGVSLVSTLLNAITPSPGERAVWLPVTMVMSGLAGYVMIVTSG
jgi:membrane protease YdiL (CAAX protease family)